MILISADLEKARAIFMSRVLSKKDIWVYASVGYIKVNGIRFRDRTTKMKLLLTMIFIGCLLNGCSLKQSQLLIHGAEFQKHMLLAEQGSADAQNKLGWMYIRGKRISPDYQEAVKWFSRASEQGHVHAQYNLGQIYFQGKGVLLDYKAAIKWFQKSAEQGNVDAQKKLGWMYVRGQGVKANNKEAVKWFQKSAEQGNVDAQNNLGVMYFKGKGISQDYVKAYLFFNVAAETGNQNAKRKKSIVTQQMTPAQIRIAKYLSTKWIQNQYCWDKDIGDCKKKAEQGDADVQYNLGIMYHKGQSAPQDYQEAIKWYTKSAKQGHAEAQNALGLVYAHGKSVPQDYSEAVKWYRKAAEQGVANAQYELGLLYAQGQAVPRDFVMAHMLWTVSAIIGHNDAKKNRAIITKNMTEAQRKESEKLVSEWVQKH